MGILHRQAIFMVRRRVRRERRVGLIEYSYDGESLRYTECNVLDIGNLPLYNVNPIFFIFLNLCHLKANIKFEKKKERDRIVLKAQSSLQISECFHVKKKKTFLSRCNFFPSLLRNFYPPFIFTTTNSWLN